jgi:hypothetical protein
MSSILRDMVRPRLLCWRITRAAHHPPPPPFSPTLPFTTLRLRPQFVELHREPLLEQLYDSFRRQYPEVVFREPPRRGSLKLEEVRRSTYFFS